MRRAGPQPVSSLCSIQWAFPEAAIVQGYRVTRIIFTHTVKGLLGLCALACAALACTEVVAAAGAGTTGAGPIISSPGTTATTLPSIEILSQQSHLAGTCGGATFDLNTFINVDNQASTDVRLAVPVIGAIEEFTDETGSNVGPFEGNYSTFHILSFGGGLPPNTPVTITLTTYTGHSLAGVVSFVSTLKFNCTTGTILTLNGSDSDALFPIPTLGDATLVALSGLLSVAGLLAIRRRRTVRR
jgi:hypothetical protein